MSRGRTYFDLTLKLVLSLSVTVASVPGFAHQGSPEPSADQSTPLTRPFDDAVQRLIEGREPANVADLRDLWAFGGQRAELFDGKRPVTYALNGAAGRPKPAFTQLEPICRDGQLIIEASRGRNERNEGGQVVGRIFIPGLTDLVACAHDREILALVDRAGRLHLIDWGFVTETAFTSVIPVQRAHWRPETPRELGTDRVTAQFITRGMNPVEVAAAEPGAVVPTDAKGEVRLNAGDLLVRVNDHVFGVFDRGVMHQNMEATEAFILAQAAWLRQTPAAMEDLGALLEDPKRPATLDMQIRTGPNLLVNPMVSMALRLMGDEALDKLKTRLPAQSQAAARPRDWFTRTELAESFAELDATARAQEPQLTTERLVREWARFEAPEFSQDGRPSFLKDLFARRIARADQAGEKTEFQIRTAAGEARKKTIRYATLAASAATILAFMSAPAVYENLPILHQFEWMNWAYAATPDVLKDAQYRWPLMYGSLVLAGLWPVMVGVSSAFGGSLTALRNQFTAAGNHGRVAGVVNDLARTWGSLDPWQRLTSAGVRAYAHLVLSPIARAIKIGERLRPPPPDPPVPDRPRTSLAERAHLLAGLAVAHRFGIDPVTLRALEDIRSPKLSDLTAMIKDKEKRREWEAVAGRVYRELSALPLDALTEDGDLIDEQVVAQYERAKALALKVSTETYRPMLARLARRANHHAARARDAILNQGRARHDFLRKIITDRTVYGLVRDGFAIDHLIMVFQTALVGARADLAHPARLAAAFGFPWINPPHLTDIVQNTQAHFLSASARYSMLYMKLKAEVENAYAPRESLGQVSLRPNQGWTARAHEHLSQFARGLAKLPRAEDDGAPTSPLRRQTFGEAMGAVAKYGLWPKYSNFGGQMIKLIDQQISTVWAFATTVFAGRVLLGGQTMDQAAFGTAIYFMLSFTYVSSWWIVTGQGIVQNNEALNEAFERWREGRRKLTWAAREPDVDVSAQLRREGIGDLRALYQARNPSALDAELDAELAGAASPELGARWLEFSAQHSPGAVAAPAWLSPLMNLFAAVGSTATMIPLIVQTYDPANASWSALGQYALYAAMLTGFTIAATHRVTWDSAHRRALCERILDR